MQGADEFFAHSRVGEPLSAWEPLREHLEAVGRTAATNAAAFESEEWGALAGLWHDLGKYLPEFQARIRGSAEQCEHAGAGAALSHVRKALPLAFVIAGHHAGLANRTSRGDTSRTPLDERIKANAQALTRILSIAPSDILERKLPPIPKSLCMVADQRVRNRRIELWTRFLFSALVDADYLETERFYSPGRRARTMMSGTTEELSSALAAHLNRLAGATAARGTFESPVNVARRRVLDECLQAAQWPPGLFSLTVPTGGGKTLSAMAFALEHARRHGLRRVIVVIPYTSIIEQNAKEYKKVFGDDRVLEHHSNIDEFGAYENNREVELRRRLATENWDAPIVVTTTVQFFESLLADRPSRCRKLHNIARSVIVLDEVQSLPPQFLRCILDVLGELADTYKCSIVLSTATPPALKHREHFDFGLRNVREIAADPPALGRALRRVRMVFPQSDAPLSWEELANRLREEPKVLVVVHRRLDARELARMVPEPGRFHLSALMCAAHRTAVLAGVREALGSGGECRLVSTQLIEAGVDVDFPVVYRAMAGLDSLVQAAGRCNREGRLAEGIVHVFRAPTQPPKGTPAKAKDVAESMLKSRGGSIDTTDPVVFEEYFRRLYATESLDRSGVQTEREEFNFANVADRFRLIEDDHHLPVVVPYGDSANRLAAYRQLPGRETLRGLQPFVVSVTRREFDALRKAGALEAVHEHLHALTTLFEIYDPEFGLVVEDPKPEPDSLIL